MPLRIAIVGAGGVGGLLGVRLANAGHRVGFVVRRECVRELRDSGLRVSSPAGELSLADLEVTDRPVDLGAADAVVLCTKTYDLAETAAALVPIVAEPTIVVTLQNGVDAESNVRVEAMREVVAVGRAHGVALPADAIERSLAVVASLPADVTSSMHEDLLAGRPLEIDHLSGAVVRLG